MKKIKLRIKLGIDLAMIAAFLINMFTGFAMFFGLVTSGGRQYRGVEEFNALSLSNIGTKAWFIFIHEWSGILMIVLILVHLSLNWNTLWCYLRNTIKYTKNKGNEKEQKEQISCENI